MPLPSRRCVCVDGQTLALYASLDAAMNAFSMSLFACALSRGSSAHDWSTLAYAGALGLLWKSLKC